jgi:hypothetical protein
METLVQKETTTDLTRKGTCIEFFSAYQDLDTDRMIGLFTTDATVDFLPLGDGGKGQVSELGKGLWTALMDCFPDIDNTIDTMEIYGDAVICKVVIFGTQAKDFAGIESKGLRFETEHIFIFQFDDEDKITAVSINWNHASFSQQLGA